MNKNDNYKEILAKSLSKNFYMTQQNQDNIKKILFNKNLIEDYDSDLKHIIRFTEDDEILNLIVKEIEKYEYKKSYRYCFLYKLIGDENVLEKVKQGNKKELFNETEIDVVSTKLKKPSIHILADKIQIKFSYIIKNLETMKTEIKYPIIINIYLKEELLAIDFDGLSSQYKTEEFYTDTVKNIEEWLKAKLKINFEVFPTFKTAELILKSKTKNPKPYENINEFLKYGYDPFEGKVRLRSNKKDDMPLISDLKQLLETFENVNDKMKLEKHIKELEELYDFYTRGIEWIFNGTKISVAFQRKYNKTTKTLIHFYYKNLNSERREYVIKYLGEKNKTLSKRKRKIRR